MQLPAVPSLSESEEEGIVAFEDPYEESAVSLLLASQHMSTSQIVHHFTAPIIATSPTRHRSIWVVRLVARVPQRPRRVCD